MYKIVQLHGRGSWTETGLAFADRDEAYRVADRMTGPAGTFVVFRGNWFDR